MDEDKIEELARGFSQRYPQASYETHEALVRTVCRVAWGPNVLRNWYADHGSTVTPDFVREVQKGFAQLDQGFRYLIEHEGTQN